LVHEAYLSWLRQDAAQWKDRAHFLGVAAQMMRRIFFLIDTTRAARPTSAALLVGAISRTARNPGAARPSISRFARGSRRVRGFDEQKARVVELRFFGGLSVDEASEVLGISRDG